MRMCDNSSTVMDACTSSCSFHGSWQPEINLIWIVDIRFSVEPYLYKLNLRNNSSVSPSWPSLGHFLKVILAFFCI